MRSVFEISWQTLLISVNDKYPTNDDLRVLGAQTDSLKELYFSRGVIYLPLKAAPDPDFWQDRYSYFVARDKRLFEKKKK